MAILIGFFIKKINMNKTKQAFYTFAFESSGISYQTDLIPEVGNVFNYWGYKWIVTNIDEEEEYYIVDVKKYKK